MTHVQPEEPATIPVVPGAVDGPAGARITALDCYDVRFPTSLEHDGSDAMNPDPDYSAAYAVLRTDAPGLEGHALCFTIGRGNEVMVTAVAALGRHVVGRYVTDIVTDLGGFSAAMIGDSQLRWLGPEKGVMHMAIGAVVNAAWDLAAKVAGKPVWRLLADMPPELVAGLIDFRYLEDALTPGEALGILRAARAGRDERIAELERSGYPAYTSTPGWIGYSDEKLTALSRQAVADGFTQIKLKVGADIAADLRRMALAREAVGPGIRIAVDANQRWGIAEAETAIAALAPWQPYWVEEPTSPDEILGLAKIRSAIAPVKVAVGEHVANRVIFKQILQAGAADVLTIDACRVAGINENLAILLLAAKYGVPVCPHAGGVGLCEMVQHLAMFDYIGVSASRADRVLEYVGHLHEHFTHPVRVTGGRYLAPAAPGFSATLRQQSLRDYVFPGGAVWQRLGNAAAPAPQVPLPQQGQYNPDSPEERHMSRRRRLVGTALLAAAGLLAAACSSSSSSTTAPASTASTGSGSAAAATSPSSGQVTIGVDLTYNNTAFWAAYINYETQYAQQMHIKLLGPLLAAANASLQNQQIEQLVNEGAQAIVVNPETATSLGPAISYATAHHVQLVSVDTIVGVGHVYMVVRASNTLYGQDACAYISSKVKSGYVLDLEGDLTSSNGADRTNAFDSCMTANDPGVKILKDPTVWTDATAVTDAQNAINAYGSQLKAIYSQWSSPDTGIIPLLKSKGLGPGSANPVILISDDGVPFEMCDIGNGSVTASQSQPANLYAQYALTYAVDAAKGVTLSAGQPGGGAPTLQNVTYQGDTNLADPIVAPFVTKAATTLTLASPVDGLPGSVTTTPVTDQALWGNVYGAAHGGVCASS